MRNQNVKLTGYASTCQEEPNKCTYKFVSSKLCLSPYAERTTHCENGVRASLADSSSSVSQCSLSVSLTELLPEEEKYLSFAHTAVVGTLLLCKSRCGVIIKLEENLGFWTLVEHLGTGLRCNRGIRLRVRGVLFRKSVGKKEIRGVKKGTFA